MKRLILITLLVSVYFVPPAFAHSHLESSAPSDGEVITEELREILLTFNGMIEKGSTFELMNSNGKAISIEDITVTDNGVIGTLPNGLENGKYDVVWKIISSDGHQMEGEYSFVVDIAVTETPSPTNDNEKESVNENMEDSEANHDISEQESKQKTSETENDVAGDQTKNEGSSTLVPILAILLILAMIIIFMVLRRKK